MPDWFTPEWFKQNGAATIGLVGAVLAAIIALVSVVVGANLTFLSAWIMRNRDLKLKLWERFIDRRIAAHESVITIALTMRAVSPLEGKDSTGEIIRAPQVMLSKQAFDEWFREFSQTAAPATTWLSTAVKRELNFVQDYFVTIHQNVPAEIPREGFANIGSFIRQDFIDLSTKLEKLAFEYFQTGAFKLRLNDLTEHHKYPRQETERRFRETILIGKWTDVQALIQQSRPLPHPDSAT